MTTNLLLSIMLGILNSVVPNLVFSKTFWRSSNSGSRQIVKSMFWGTGFKHAVFILLGVIFLQLPNLRSVAFFSALLTFELIRLFWNWFSLPKVVLR